jgi:Sulfotransferase family
MCARPAMDVKKIRELPFVVIVTAGRTGSTLLQGILNDFDGFLIRGENSGFLTSLYGAYQSVLVTRSMRSSPTPRSPWFGAHSFSEETFLNDAASMIFSQFIDVPLESLKAIGFKEIRWLFEGKTPLWGVLDFIEKLFPNAIFIFLTRDRAQMMKSGWWIGEDNSETHFMLDQFELLTRHAPVKKLFEIDYSNLVAGDSRLMELCSFLGQPYSEKIEKTLQLKHNF